METRLLVAVSNEAEHLYGVQFICHFFNQVQNLSVTLCHVSLTGGHMKRDLTRMWDGPASPTAALAPGARRAMSRSDELLSRCGLPKSGLCTTVIPEQYGLVKDILAEGNKKNYDAVVLGRRASYALQWFFERPAEKVAEEAITDSAFELPLWVCLHAGSLTRNIMVCIDGSENSLRAVDHVGFIVADQPRHGITLFSTTTVSHELREECFGKATRILNNYGVENERISRKVSGGRNIPAAILREAEQGTYAAVAVGFRGLGSNDVARKPAGSITISLVRKTERVSIWCVP